MKYAVDSKQMKLIDEYAIQTIKIPQAVLMERAAKAIVDVMVNQIKKSDRILVVCGPGNNGGDGIAAGRILYLQGYQVAILFLGDETKTSEGFRSQMKIAMELGMTKEHHNNLHEYNIIIDAIFGVGLARSVTGLQEEIIHRINSMDCFVFSVDMPSGISAENGKILNTAIQADATITFGQQKLGLLLYPGADYAGVITVADIGFPDSAVKECIPDMFYYTTEDLKRLPARKNYSNKGTYGKVLIIAGSKGMSGAAYLSAKAAYRSGAGLVKVLTSKENRIILQTSIPEALFAAYDEDESLEDNFIQKLKAELSWASVVVIGPGLGLTKTTQKLLMEVIGLTSIPLIIDADGITLLSKVLDENVVDNFGQNSSNIDKGDFDIVQSRLNYLSSIIKPQTIITPHLMELSRLLGISISDISNNLVDTARQCSYNNDLIYAIKDARSIVTQGGLHYINVSGNNGMATGGSGDILTGIIAALIAQGMKSYEATCLAVYLHGLAGDAAAKERGQYSMMAGDIVDSIEKVLKMASDLT